MVPRRLPVHSVLTEDNISARMSFHTCSFALPFFWLSQAGFLWAAGPKRRLPVKEWMRRKEAHESGYILHVDLGLSWAGAIAKWSTAWSLSLLLLRVRGFESHSLHKPFAACCASSTRAHSSAVTVRQQQARQWPRSQGPETE